MKSASVLLLLLASFSALAAPLPCSIHPTKGIAASALPGLAKIPMADAKATALAAYKGRSATVTDGELEVEATCLIYSFDVRLARQTGIEEVTIDAGTGAMLSRQHETPKQEANEAAADQATAGKH